MGFLRRMLRPRVLRTSMVPDETWVKLLRQHPILKGLSGDEERRLRELTTLFLHEKTFSAAEGIELTDYLHAVIAVQACLPILGLDLDWYQEWRTVVVVPDVFTEEYAEPDEAGVVHEWEEDDRSGTSWDEGPVVLSWEDIEASGWGDGYNVVIHEAAHRLDQTDGAINGCPILHHGMDPEEWRRVFSGSFEDLRRRKRSRKRRSKIDSYATESDAEFFAAASEYFFEKPRILTGEYPDVYRLLAMFYRQDPAGRLAGGKPRRAHSSS
jgi:Mlc titration factor MtfA (ptsG expression regulator)